MGMPENDFLLNFRLFECAGDWLVYDVMVNGMSLIDNYRDQFVRTLDTMPYEQVDRPDTGNGGTPLAHPRRMMEI